MKNHLTKIKLLDESKIDEKLDTLDLSKPVEIAILNYTNSVQQILTKIFKKCEEKSFSNPKILVNKRIIPLVKANNPENISINEFDQDEISDANLTFLSEMEFDGLFGFQTTSTRLLTTVWKIRDVRCIQKKRE